MASPRLPAPLALALALLLGVITVAAAQEPAAKSAEPMFEPTTAFASARATFDGALDTWLRFRTSDALPQFRQAVDLDPDFGLARMLAVNMLPFGERDAVLDRAVADAAHASVEELLLLVARREAHRGNIVAARALRRTAAELITDPRMDLLVAWSLPTPEQRSMMRELVRDHPEFAPAAAGLAWTLVPSPFATVALDELAEAERAARQALGLEPDQPYTHAVLAQVLVREGERAEARTHLGHATSSSTRLPLAYRLLAQMDVQDGRLQEARQVLERALASEDAPPLRRQWREAIALTHLHEGDLEQTLRAYETIAADADATNNPTAASGYYATAAIIAAGADDATRFDRYGAEAIERRPERASVEWEIIGAAFLGRAAAAADALERHLQINANSTSRAAEEGRERMRGYVELARGNAAAAVAHFERAGRNPYTQLGQWEAYHDLGNTAAADAVRKDLVTRKDFSLMSTATPTARYRAAQTM